MTGHAEPARLLIAVELVPDGGVLMAELAEGESTTLQLPNPVVDQEGKSYTGLDITVFDKPSASSSSPPDGHG
jgi:hypothetical protein